MLCYTSAVQLSDFAGYTGLIYREAREIPAHNVPYLWPKPFLFQTETDLYNLVIKNKFTELSRLYVNFITPQTMNLTTN